MLIQIADSTLPSPPSIPRLPGPRRRGHQQLRVRHGPRRAAPPLPPQTPFFRHLLLHGCHSYASLPRSIPRGRFRGTRLQLPDHSPDPQTHVVPPARRLPRGHPPALRQSPAGTSSSPLSCVDLHQGLRVLALRRQVDHEQRHKGD